MITIRPPSQELVTGAVSRSWTTDWKHRYGIRFGNRICQRSDRYWLIDARHQVQWWTGLPGKWLVNGHVLQRAVRTMTLTVTWYDGWDQGRWFLARAHSVSNSIGRATILLMIGDANLVRFILQENKEKLVRIYMVINQWLTSRSRQCEKNSDSFCEY